MALRDDVGVTTRRQFCCTGSRRFSALPSIGLKYERDEVAKRSGADASAAPVRHMSARPPRASVELATIAICVSNRFVARRLPRCGSLSAKRRHRWLSPLDCTRQGRGAPKSVAHSRQAKQPWIAVCSHADGRIAFFRAAQPSSGVASRPRHSANVHWLWGDALRKQQGRHDRRL